MPSISKSQRKAARCPVFYQQGRDARIASPLRDAGTDFHRYKDEYVDHLVSSGQARDEEWAWAWLGASGVCEDARRMIEWDIYQFEIDPDIVVGTEQFLVIDEDFKPIMGVRFPGFGKAPDVPRALAHGTMDLLLMPNMETIIDEDYKTGWNPYFDKEEAEHYATLLFCHFDTVETVIFRQVKPRTQLPPDEVTFTRERDFERLKTAMLNASSRLSAVAEDKDPEPNPFAGLCSFCHLECPARKQMAHGPVQTKDDLVRVMGYIESTTHQLRNARNAARSYLLEAGPTPVSDEKSAAIVSTTRLEYPLASTLAAMGIEVPPRCEEWDIDLDKLKISSTDLQLLAGAKKRAGLQEQLEPAAKETVWRELKVFDASSPGSIP